MKFNIKSFSIEDYERVFKLWQETKNIILSDTDSIESMRIFLDRNPDLSLIALHGDKLVGSILCSHDGRRGYLHHLAVKKNYPQFRYCQAEFGNGDLA